MVKDKKVSWTTVSVAVLILGFAFFLMISCGRVSGSPTQTGIFKDVVICGLGYSTAPGELSGTTNSQGEFYYKKGDKITFFIGNIEIGAAMAKNSLTLQDLVFGTEGVDDPAMANLERFIQSLDVEPNANIIELPAGLTDVVNSWLIIQAGRPFGVELDADEFEDMAMDLLDYLDAQMVVYSGLVKLVGEEGVVT